MGAGGFDGGATPGPGQLAGMMTPDIHGLAAQHMAQANVPMTPEQYNAMRWEREVEARNAPLSDEDLDLMLPSEGYKILETPASYVPIRTPARKLTATPAPYGGATPGFYAMPDEDRGQAFDVPDTPADLPNMKPEDYQYFAPLLKETEDEELSLEEQKERKIMKLLLKVKNGTPPQRKSALRQLTDKAREFGAGPLFNQILPLLMSPTLEDQERHLLVKVIDRILYKLDDLVRPYVHKILVVIEPLLIDEDYYARVEGREIISNLSKAAGLATMIAAMRPDIDNVDEYVRNTTARAFAVVAQALGDPRAAPFPQGRVPVEEVVAGEAHGDQDLAADRHPPGLRGASPSASRWSRSSSTACRMRTRRCARSPRSPSRRSRSPPRRTASSRSTASSSRCGRVSARTAGRCWRRFLKPSASSSPSWTPCTPTTTPGR